MGSRQQDIDISNIEMWWLHHNTYKFLPKLKMNSSVSIVKYAYTYIYIKKNHNIRKLFTLMNNETKKYLNKI